MWQDLSLSDKARMIQLAVNSGITDLSTIQAVYNKFAEGGPEEKLIDRINTTSNANFVKRLQDPNRKYIKNPDGTISTHRMAYVTTDEDAIVYPEIQEINGRLMRVAPEEAFESAVAQGDTLHMSVPQAEWFTTHYKDYYPKGNTFGEGGSIHIKKENRGKFTALKKRTGHSASWFKAHGTPAQKKMATFALNARKWKHAEGGYLADSEGKRKDKFDKPVSWYVTQRPELYPNLSRVRPEYLDKYFYINGDGQIQSNLARDSYYQKREELKRSLGQIGYDKDKEIMFTTNGANARYRTGKISTTLLDYIYDNAAKAKIPFREAVGLAGKESTLGIGRGYKEGASVSPIDLYSYWVGIGAGVKTNTQTKKMEEIYKKLWSGETIDEALLTKQEAEYQKMLDGLHEFQGDNLIKSAYDYYKAGKYNPGEKGYDADVLLQGDVILQDKAVQEWLKTKKKYKGRGFLSGGLMTKI